MDDSDRQRHEIQPCCQTRENCRVPEFDHKLLYMHSEGGTREFGTSCVAEAARRKQRHAVASQDAGSRASGSCAWQQVHSRPPGGRRVSAPMIKTPFRLFLNQFRAAEKPFHSQDFLDRLHVWQYGTKSRDGPFLSEREKVF